MTRTSARERVRRFVEHPRFINFIIVLILVNAAMLGLETSKTVMAQVGGVLHTLDRIVIYIFVVEVGLRIYAHRLAFFRDPWSLFDLFVVGLSIAPATDTFATLRALRVLRVLRLISVMPRMRGVVEALLGALPGMGAVISLLAVVFYVAAVIATNLFGEAFPEWFGTLGASLYSLFQVMTLESWSMGIVRPVMEVFPWAWAFFVPFILGATFTMLNLFIAVIVEAMQTQHAAEASDRADERDREAHAEREAMHQTTRDMAREVAELRAEVRELLRRLPAERPQPGKSDHG